MSYRSRLHPAAAPLLFSAATPPAQLFSAVALPPQLNSSFAHIAPRIARRCAPRLPGSRGRQPADASTPSQPSVVHRRSVWHAVPGSFACGSVLPGGNTRLGLQRWNTTDANGADRSMGSCFPKRRRCAATRRQRFDC
jgi:hypothetical protein